MARSLEELVVKKNTALAKLKKKCDEIQSSDQPGFLALLLRYGGGPFWKSLCFPAWFKRDLVVSKSKQIRGGRKDVFLARPVQIWCSCLLPGSVAHDMQSDYPGPMVFCAV